MSNLSFILDKLDNLALFLDEYTYQNADFLFSLQQRFKEGETEIEMLNQTDLWSFSIPHEDSGPCYTYNPPYESDPGYPNSIFLVLSFEDWLEDLDIFLHEKGKFFFQDGIEGIKVIHKNGTHIGGRHYKESQISKFHKIILKYE